MESYFFNKEVVVEALYFRGKDRLAGYPKRIVVDNEPVTFNELGLQYVVQRGQKLLKRFDMTDGKKQYQLELEPEEQRWRLLHVAPMGAAA